MKWNNRLKSVLTDTQKSDFSGECLETELRITAESQKSDVSAVIRSSNYRHSFKNNEDIREIKSEKLHTILNRFIERGVSFDVSADDFLTIDPAQNLKLSELEFLQINNAAILCQLQQSLLTKHLFSPAPEQFEDFAFEIAELESLLPITAKTPFENYFNAVCQITAKWFSKLLTTK